MPIPINDREIGNDKTTAIVFAVNQLCPSSIGIYPLVIIHPKPLPRLQVRSINLIMTGSPGFGSNWMDFLCVHLAFHLTQSIYLLTHYAIGNWSPYFGLSTVGLSVSGSISLPLGFLLQLSLSVLYTIAIQFDSALAFAHNHLSNQSCRSLDRQMKFWPLSFRSSLLREFSFDLLTNYLDISVHWLSS